MFQYLQTKICPRGQNVSIPPPILYTTRSLDKYLSTSKEKILKPISHSRIIENNNYGRSKEEIHEEYREKYEGKPLHGQLQKKSYRGSKR